MVEVTICHGLWWKKKKMDQFQCSKKVGQTRPAPGHSAPERVALHTSEWERLLSMDDLKTANLSPLAVKASVMQLIAASSDNWQRPEWRGGGRSAGGCGQAIPGVGGRAGGPIKPLGQGCA